MSDLIITSSEQPTQTATTATATAAAPESAQPATEAAAPASAVTGQEPAAGTEAAQGQTDGTQAPEGEDGQHQKRKGRDIQKRFDELTRQREDAKAEADYWRRLATGQQQPAGQQPTQQTPAPADDPEPVPEQFNDLKDYAKALAEWTADRKVKEALADQRNQEAQQQAQKQQQDTAKAWSDRQESVRNELPDYDEVLVASDIALPGHVMQAIVESDVGPKIAYHLAKNPAEAEKLLAMTPTAALKEIGRIEGRLSASATSSTTAQPAASKPVETSKAPAPISPVSGSSSAEVKDPEKMSFEEWKEYRQKQRRKG
ncbi:MAG: hypothetical protein ACM3VY_00230 [Candidatus Bathyarchaeota archaeon]